MKTLKNDWLIWIMLFIPFVFVAYCWNKLPDQIATHFDLEGNPNDYSSKAFGVLFMPALNIGMYFLFITLPMIDPRRKNYGLFSDKFKIIRTVLHIFLTFTFFLTTFYALGYKFNLSMLIMYGVLGLILVLGNYMGNMRPNFFIGIRTPWTLSNEEVWTKTHRLTAKLWVISTLIMVVAFPFLPHMDVIFMIYVGAISIVPIVYSYILYRKIAIEKP